MDVCPLAKTGQELVLDLVNAENNSEITVDQLMFGTPQAGDEDGNTGLNLAAAPDSPWNKDVDIVYDRLDLNTLFHGQRAELSAPKGATKEDIVCHLNFTYDLKFTASEFDLTAVEDGELPELFKLKAKEGNLAYTGEMDIFVDLDRMPLSARLLKTDLNGFRYPNADEPSLNNVVYKLNETSLTRLGNIGAWSTPPTDLRDEWLTGMKSANNGELFIYVGADVSTNTPQQIRGNYSKFNWPYEDGVMVFPQMKLGGDVTQRAFYISCGFRRANALHWTATELLALYDITAETFSRNTLTNDALGNGYTRRATAIIHPSNPQVVQWMVEGSGPESWSVVNDSVNGNWFRSSIQPAGSGLLPGFRSWSGSGASRAHGEGHIIITAKRKDGKGKPMVLRLDFRTSPVK